MRFIIIRSVVAALVVAAPAAAFDWPVSEFLSAETRAVLFRQRQEIATLRKACPVVINEAVTGDDVAAIQRCWSEHYYRPLIAKQRRRYQVTIQSRVMAGVPTDIIAPVAEIPAGNRHRVLINVHGGAFHLHGAPFTIGGREAGEIESIPIAALSQIEVVAVNYRMSPGQRFPAASEDVTAVYKALLRHYKPGNIGLYGVSAGGLVAAQALVLIRKTGLPSPGAVGLLSTSLFAPLKSDSTNLAVAVAGSLPAAPGSMSYFAPADLENSAAFPGLALDAMTGFPATLLITSTRDRLLSDAVSTHRQLMKLGVRVDLQVWEGLDHAFLYEPGFPESREAYEVIVRFFADNLRT